MAVTVNRDGSTTSNQTLRASTKTWARSFVSSVAIVFAWYCGSITPSSAQILERDLARPSTLVPRTLAPEVRRTPSGVSLPETALGTSAPPGSDRVTLRIGDVAFEGGEAELAGQTEAARAALRGRTVSVQEAYAVAATLERAYAQRGYFLTRVVIPPQDVRQGGTLRIRVLQGFIESVDASTLPDQVRRRAEAMLAPIVGRQRISLAEFERQVLLAGEIPGLALRTTLASGTQPAGVRLVLQGEFRPFSVDITGDNSASRAAGTWVLNVNGTVNSPTGNGEQIYATVSGAPTHSWIGSVSPRRLLAAGFNLPIGVDGLQFNAEGTVSDSRPRTFIPTALATQGEYSRLALRVTYPVIRTRTDTVVLRGTFEVVHDELRNLLFDTVSSEDRYRVMRTGLDWTRVFSSTRTQLSLGGDITQGFRGIDSRGRDRATFLVPLSRDGSDDIFTKGEARLRIVQPLGANLALDVSARGQYAFTGALVGGERISLGGPRALSAHDSGAFGGDHGWLTRAELFYSGPLTSWSNGGVIPYLFAARGQAINENPTAVEPRVTGATNVGIGARASVLAAGGWGSLQSMELGVEAARQFNDGPREDQWRFNINGALRF